MTVRSKQFFGSPELEIGLGDCFDCWLCQLAVRMVVVGLLRYAMSPVNIR